MLFFLGLKVVVLFLATVVVMRMMGKSIIVQLTPYDLVAIFIVATVASEPLVTDDFTLREALVSLGILVVVYLLFSGLTLNQAVSDFFLGQPTILVKHGKLVEEGLEKARMSLMQLMATLRAGGYPELQDIAYAILEPIGELSVIPTSKARPVSPADLNLETDYRGLPMVVVADGVVQEKNLQLLDKDLEWLMEKLEVLEVSLKEVLIATLDESGHFYINYRREGGGIAAKDLKLEEEHQSAGQGGSLDFICEGRWQLGALHRVGLEKKKLLDVVKEKSASGADDLLELKLVWKIKEKEGVRS